MWLLENLKLHIWTALVAHIIFLLDSASPELLSVMLRIFALSIWLSTIYLMSSR